jgi:hypothetical protein
MLRFPAWTGRLAVCSSLLTSGCDNTKRPPEPASPIASAQTTSEGRALEVGQSLEHAAARIKLASQRECSTSSQDPSSNDYRLWAAELEITNRSTVPLPVSAFHADLKDDDNFTYTTSLSGCSNILDARLLRENETVRGFIPFQVPKSVQSATLSYHFTAHGKTETVARFHVTF